MGKSHVAHSVARAFSLLFLFVTQSKRVVPSLAPHLQHDPCVIEIVSCQTTGAERLRKRLNGCVELLSLVKGQVILICDVGIVTFRGEESLPLDLWWPPCSAVELKLLGYPRHSSGCAIR
jgi:hypothetical protein